MKRLFIPLTVFVFLIIVLFLQQQDSLYQINGKTMGTTYTVKITGHFNKKHIKKMKKNMEQILENIEKKMSTYRSDSEISLFNKIKSTAVFPVSAETAFVVEKALAIGHLSENAFDITTGSLVNLWGFGPSKKQNVTARKIKSLLANNDRTRLIVDIQKNTLQKKVKKIQIDISGIAKGYAVDVLVDFLKQQKINHYLVEIGGELRASEKKDKDNFWQVGIQSPKEKKGSQLVLNLTRQAMATSGTYRNFYYKDKKKHTHIINPITGHPIAHNLLSVTVIAQDCLTADAWATALMVLGVKKGMKLASQYALKAYFIVADSNGLPHKTLSTAAFSSYYKRRRP